MSLRFSHVAVLGLAYALSLSCSSDDDAGGAQTDAGAGGENSHAGATLGGTSSSGTGSSGSSTGGDSTGEGATGSAHAGEASAGASGAGAVAAGGIGGDTSGTAGGTAGGAAAAGAGGAAAAIEYDFTCHFPDGTPCDQSVAAGAISVGQLTSTGDIVPGYVYVVWIESQAAENVDLRVCGSAACDGDYVCESAGLGDQESCIVQASQDFLSVYVTNQAGAAANVTVDMNADVMFQFNVPVQAQSSLAPNGAVRLLLTGLTPQTTYELSVTTTNARNVNLVASDDLHAQQIVCDEDLIGTAATCQLLATQSAVWVTITDTSGLGDGYTFVANAK